MNQYNKVYLKTPMGIINTKESEGVKYCTCCRRELPLHAFSANRRTKDGKQYYCKQCKSEMNRASYLKKIELLARYRTKRKEGRNGGE